MLNSITNQLFNFKTVNKMKKVFLLLAISSILLGCSTDESQPQVDTTKLVGTWYLESAIIDGDEVSSSDEVRFTPNGRVYYTYYDFGANGQDIIESGNYYLHERILTVEADNSDLGNEITSYTILELTESKLKLKSVIAGEGTLIETYQK